MKCRSCNAIIPADTEICPACFSPIETAQEPLAAPVAESRPVEIQPEASRETREGQQCTPPRENAVRGNTEGRFFRTSSSISKKTLFLVLLTVILVLLVVLVVVGPSYRTATHVAVAPAVNETPTSITDMPPKTIEAPAEAKPGPAPVHQEKKVVKKTPQASTPKVQAPAPTPKWTYRPDSQPKTVPQAQKKSAVAGWLDRTLGPEVPVTAPSNDPRYTGQ